MTQLGRAAAPASTETIGPALREKSLVEVALDRQLARRFDHRLVEGRIRDLKTAEALDAFLERMGNLERSVGWLRKLLTFAIGAES
jgi:hypothetical protein